MCKLDKKHIVEELKNKHGIGWHVYLVNIYQKSSLGINKLIGYTGLRHFVC